MVQLTEDVPQISKFFAGRSVLITGATGFMGKVLCERLLSTCPDISCLYLLIRPKNDLPTEKRLDLMKQSQVFDVLRGNSPHQLEKLQVVTGDLTKDMLGLSQDSVAQLKDVSVVFHSAATLKFNEKLRLAVNLNLRPVICVLEICDVLPNVLAFIYVSTAYSNSEFSRVEEKVYPPAMKLETLMKKLKEEDMDEEKLAEFIFPKPNTYIFSKAMAEHVIAQHKNKGYSSAIFRPSIVVSSLHHPTPGWIENLNGPSGVIVFTGKGFLRVMRCNGSMVGDMIPVDIAVDTMIGVAWETALHQSSSVRVYNCTSTENPMTWGEFKNYLNKYLREYPLENAFWVPELRDVHNAFLYNIQEVLLQTIPLYSIWYFMKLFGYKTRINLIKANKNVIAMHNALSVFALRQWHFDNNNVRRLRQKLSSKDKVIYNLDPNTIVWEDHIRDFVKGIRKYVLKEKEQDLPAARRHMKVLHRINNGLKCFVFFLFFILFIIFLDGTSN